MKGFEFGSQKTLRQCIPLGKKIFENQLTIERQATGEISLHGRKENSSNRAQRIGPKYRLLLLPGWQGKGRESCIPKKECITLRLWELI